MNYFLIQVKEGESINDFCIRCSIHPDDLKELNKYIIEVNHKYVGVKSIDNINGKVYAFDEFLIQNEHILCRSQHVWLHIIPFLKHRGFPRGPSFNILNFKNTLLNIDKEYDKYFSENKKILITKKIMPHTRIFDLPEKNLLSKIELFVTETYDEQFFKSLDSIISTHTSTESKILAMQKVANINDPKYLSKLKLFIEEYQGYSQNRRKKSKLKSVSSCIEFSQIRQILLKFNPKRTVSQVQSGPIDLIIRPNFVNHFSLYSSQNNQSSLTREASGESKLEYLKQKFNPQSIYNNSEYKSESPTLTCNSNKVTVIEVKVFSNNLQNHTERFLFSH